MEKIELTDEHREQIEKLAGVLNQEQIADFLGFTGRTLRNIFDRDDEAFSAYQRGRAQAVADVGGNLLQKARNGDTTSQIFYLKTQAGWRETQEHIIEDLPPLNVNITSRDPVGEVRVTKHGS